MKHISHLLTAVVLILLLLHAQTSAQQPKSIVLAVGRNKNGIYNYRQTNDSTFMPDYISEPSVVLEDLQQFIRTRNPAAQPAASKLKKLLLGVVSLALAEDGTLYCWGYNGGFCPADEFTGKAKISYDWVRRVVYSPAAASQSTKKTIIGFNETIVDIAATVESFVVLTDKNKLYSNGASAASMNSGDFNQVPNRSIWEIEGQGIRQIEMNKANQRSREVFCLLTIKFAELYCAGNNANGLIGKGISTRESTSILTRISKQAIDNNQRVVKFCMGESHLVLLTDSGNVFCYGDSLQCGATFQQTLLEPQRVPNSSGIDSISCGADYTLMKNSTGYYALGTGQGTGLRMLTLLSYSDLFKQDKVQVDTIVLTSEFSLAIANNGSLFQWGRLNFLNIPNITMPLQDPLLTSHQASNVYHFPAEFGEYNRKKLLNGNFAGYRRKADNKIVGIGSSANQQLGRSASTIPVPIQFHLAKSIASMLPRPPAPYYINAMAQYDNDVYGTVFNSTRILKFTGIAGAPGSTSMNNPPIEWLDTSELDAQGESSITKICAGSFFKLAVLTDRGNIYVTSARALRLSRKTRLFNGYTNQLESSLVTNVFRMECGWNQIVILLNNTAYTYGRDLVANTGLDVERRDFTSVVGGFEFETLYNSLNTSVSQVFASVFSTSVLTTSGLLFTFGAIKNK